MAEGFRARGAFARTVTVVLLVLLTTACTTRVTGYVSPIAHDYGSVEWHALEQTIVQPFVAGPGHQAAIANDGKTTPEQFQERLAALPEDARNGTLEEITVGLRLEGASEMQASGVWDTGARVQIVSATDSAPIFDVAIDDLPRDGDWVLIERPPQAVSGHVISLRLVPGDGPDAGRLRFGVIPDRAPYGGWVASIEGGNSAGGALLLRTTYERDVALRQIASDSLGNLRDAARDDLLFSVAWALALGGLLAGGRLAMAPAAGAGGLRMVVERSRRSCLLCGRPFEGRTFLCRACSDEWRGQAIPADVRTRFYEALDRAYPERSNTYGNWNVPVMLLREIKRLPRNLRILELGAGGGFFAAELDRRGFTNLTLSDFTATTLAALRERLPAAQLVGADGARLPFRDGAFDVVISTDVIEHIPEAVAHIAEVARVLASGGRYYVKTPNRPLAEAFYRLRGMHDAYFWHPSMFSSAELRAAFARHGLSTRILAQPRLTGAQLAKLPGPRALRRLAGALPLGWLPPAMLPHLEAVASKRGDDADRIGLGGSRPMGMRFTGERIIPELPELRVTFLQSLAAYEYAASFVPGKRVLDCGCGEGYGTALLAEQAALAVGLDREPEVVAYAAEKYRTSDRAAFVAARAKALPFADASIDVVVCFQVIEHLPDPLAFLHEVRRLLAPGGVFMLTTPNLLVTGARPNPHHVHDYTPDDLRSLLRRVFDDVELHGIFGGEKVAAYRAKNDRIVRTIMRLDPLGLHRKIPTRLVEAVHIRVTRFIRGRLNASDPALVSNLTTADFPIATDGIERAIDLLGVCRKHS